MANIKLYFDPEYSAFDSLAITIDNQTVDWNKQYDYIDITTSNDFGIYILTVKLSEEQARIKFTDVQINGASLRMLIFLSWQEREDGTKDQPQTALWHIDQTWHLPFGNPVSFWNTLALNKFPLNDFGQDLYKKYYIHYPDSLEVEGNIPSVIKDFFKHNFDFHCVPKEEGTRRLPWLPANIEIDPTKIKQAVADVEKSKDYLYANRAVISQEAYNTKEFGSQQGWWLIHFIKLGEQLVDYKHCPGIYDLVKSLNIKNDIYQMFLGVLPPGASIAPHHDYDPVKKSYYRGLSIIYIPLVWPKGNVFKFAGAKAIIDDKPILINIQDHVHALTNTSDQERLILNIVIDIENNPHLLPSNV